MIEPNNLLIKYSPVRFLLITGFHGVGKSTLRRKLMQQLPDKLTYLPRTVYRFKPGNLDNIYDTCISFEEYENLVAQGKLIMDRYRAGKEIRYGVNLDDFEKTLSKRKIIITESDTLAKEFEKTSIPSIKKISIMPCRIVDFLEDRESIFPLLRNRLIDREKDITNTDLEFRLEKIKKEIDEWDQKNFDAIIENTNEDEALQNIIKCIGEIYP